jgi:hypothetical protein
MRRSWAACLGAPILALSSTSAAAPRPAAEQEADERFQKGMQLASEGHAEEARVMFLEAYSIAPTFNTLWNLAVAEHDAGHTIEALRHLRLVMADPRADAQVRATAEKLVADAYAKTGHLRLIGTAGSTILVDGMEVASYAPPTAMLDVTAGSHRLEVRASRGSERRDVDATAGVVTEAKFGQAGIVPPEVPPAVRPGPGGQEAKVAATSSAARFAVTGALGAGTVGCLAGGIVVLLSANSDHDRAVSLLSGLPDNGCVGSSTSACVQGNDALRREASARNMSTGLFIAAGALAGGAVASWFLLAPSGSHDEGAWFVPELSPKSAALTMRGRF